MQHKLYTIQFSQRAMTDLPPVPEQRSRNLEFLDFENFTKFPQMTELLEKFKLLDKRGFELMEERERMPAPRPAPIHKRSVASMVWNASPAQLGLAAWPCSLPAPARLLIG